ncbi:MmgE/PrpD family protein [Bordetella genomosp. 11]|uniref:2-methylcitrate dehydratase n=1 Tax=Bordetella genomosp. 11 TaxID=1416808 RepID=A0A261UZB6_9BORD|nr:MmgE/PrpD family protein [Bordetella genomosp. 11]OZI67005.1 2-methylcitrate dehydratase [Bordetella genomosp. 11]
MQPEQDASAHIARWVATLRPDAMPPAVRARARACLLDTVGVALAGSATAAARYARALADETSAQGACTALGSARRYDACAAAFVNGTAAHAQDFDDNCYAGFVHGSAAIVPAVLSVGERQDATGADAVSACVAGAECEYAVGAATRSRLYERGWWTTGVLGPIGASMAAAWLLRLDESRTHAALGLAIAGAGGMKACFGSDAKPLGAGHAARAGVACALLALHGASGPRQALEGANGLADLFNEGIFDEDRIGALGRHWYLEQPGVDVKRIPVCLSSHAAADAVAELAAEHGVSADDVEEVLCDVPPIVLANLKYDAPASPREAQFSMPFAIAVTLLHGKVALRHLSGDVLADPGLRALMARIRQYSGERWRDDRLRERAPEGAAVHLRLRDGRTLERFRAVARGGAADPLSDDDLAGKFGECAGPVLGASRAAGLLAGLREVDGATPLRHILRGAAGASTA